MKVKEVGLYKVLTTYIKEAEGKGLHEVQATCNVKTVENGIHKLQGKL